MRVFGISPGEAVAPPRRRDADAVAVVAATQTSPCARSPPRPAALPPSPPPRRSGERGERGYGDAPPRTVPRRGPRRQPPASFPAVMIPARKIICLEKIHKKTQESTIDQSIKLTMHKASCLGGEGRSAISSSMLIGAMVMLGRAWDWLSNLR